ncbi:MAG: DNA helicase, partial [Fusobacterium sp.]|nr:DNA helicase [Fusobacterium sp.]
MNIEKNILNYWKEINLVAPVTIKVDEYFTKQEVISKKRLQIPYNKISDSLLLKNSLKNLSDNGIEISFGNIKNTILYNKAKIERDNIVDGEGGETFIFTFNINENGKYIVETFKVSVFLYVLLKNLISEPYKNIVEKINDFEKDVEIELKSVEKFDEDYLKKITDIILQKLEIFDTDLIEKNKVFYLKLISIKETEEVNEDRLMQMNFYNEDLERIIKNIDNSKSFLPKIIYSNLKNNERYKIDDDIDFLQEITLPKNIPLGKWPSKHNPSLMQAVAINIVTSKEYSPKIFSVNGPPGTGKTTLLKEIIADTIIKKAKIIADSDTIFENKS